LSFRKHLYPAKVGLLLAIVSIVLYFFFNLWPLVFSIAIAFTNAREENLFVNPEVVRNIDNAIACVEYLKTKELDLLSIFAKLVEDLETISSRVNATLKLIIDSANPHEDPGIYLQLSSVYSKALGLKTTVSKISEAVDCSKYGFITDRSIVSSGALTNLTNIINSIASLVTNYAAMSRDELINRTIYLLVLINTTREYFSNAARDPEGFLNSVKASFEADKKKHTLRFIGLANFANLFSDPRFYYSLMKTLLFVATSVPLKVALGFSLALLFSSNLIYGRRIMRGLLLAPWAIPILLSGLTWRYLFQPGGQLGRLFNLGIFDKEWDAFLVYNLFEAWLAYPFIMTVTMGALSSIPREVLEASYVDGAGVWLRVRKIILPLIARPLAIATILTTGASLQAFLVPLLINGGGPTVTITIPGIGSRTGNVNEMLILFGYNRAVIDKDLGYAAATYLAVLLIILVYVAAWLALSRRGGRGGF